MIIKPSLPTCAILFSLTVGLCPAKEDGNPARSPRIVNIINFIRQCEPRIDWITEEVLHDTNVL